MPGNAIHILSTRPISELLIKSARSKGIIITELSFIKTEPITTVEVQQEIEQAFSFSANVVFTSMNAVEAVADYLHEEQPVWKIYCIGNTTQQLVKKYFGEPAIAGTADNAADLADVIAKESDSEEIIFFCGNQRHDELPDKLRQHHIEVNEIEVYQTIAIPHTIDKDYTGILFFSPSAVDSFFSVNKINKQTILFAIGNTTATAIKKYTNNKIIISDTPGKENLVKEMIGFLTNEE